MEDLTGKQLGPYQVVAPLGEGGMAAVYKAYQPGMDRYVALKILPRHFASDPQFVGRFHQEAKVIAKLQHPHILPVFDFGEADGYTYIVMPFVEHGTLAGLLHGQPLPLKQIRSIISQVGDALDYAHSRGLVHRDVKPSNVLVDERGNCLLTDFGIAKIVEGTAKFTRTGGIIGTPAYMSPEQGLGQKLDGRSDIYALGVMLYEMATGRVPFNAETPMAIVIKHINDPLPPPRTVNPALPELLERVILKALAKNPEDRFQTAAGMVEALSAETSEPKRAESAARTMVETKIGLPERSPEEEAKKIQRRLPGWAWGVAVGLIVAIVGGGISAAILLPKASPNPQASPGASATPAGTEQDVMISLLTQGAETEIAARTPWAKTQAIVAMTPSRTPRPTRTPPPTASAIPAGTLLFEEGFDDGKANEFHFHGKTGDWQVVDDGSGNRVYEINVKGASIWPCAGFGSPLWGNYSVEYRVKLVDFDISTETGSGMVFLLFRRARAPVNQNYVFAFVPYWQLIEIDYSAENLSSWQAIEGQQGYAFQRDVWYSVRLEAQGKDIRAFLDGIPIMAVEDTRVEHGDLALCSGPNMIAQYDDVRVVALGQ